MRNKKQRKSLIMMALLLLVGATCGYVANTYAKYTSKIEDNNGEATVAKWAFDTDNTQQEITVGLDGTYDATTLVNGKIAPGTQGQFNVALVNTNSEVGVDWTITLNDVANKPDNLKFYKDSSYTTELTPGTSTITGQLTAKDGTGLTVPIYWKWAYETDAIATNDPIDTEDGEAAETLTIGVDITGVQTQPGAEIRSHIN